MATIKTEYLLPCPCGHKLAVDRSQAGLSVGCPQCGAALTIPTLRGLDRLERAAPEADQHAQDWGLRQAVFFVGGLLGALALLAVAFLWMTRPIYPQEHQEALIEAAGSTGDIDQMTLLQTTYLWNELSKTPESSNMLEFRMMVEDYQQAATINRHRMIAAVGGLITGALLLGAGLLIPKQKSTPR
ncbi:MAG TPA: hypothetical protein VHD36_10440 [Pirellulales bacterium]|nr:hypothetical protein [Pirellulales bacterium]